MSKKYDAIIIGAGMSGLAAAIRLAMYDKKVCLLEKHVISGGLNSYYKRGKREFDVGLHAMTNFIEKGERKKPLSKLLKQLRIPYDELNLSPQKQSRILFPDNDLTFTNDIAHFTAQVAMKFPHEIDGFNKLLVKIEEFNETALDNKTIMAKDVVGTYIKDSQLLEMIFCPLLIYGSAWENDMDFSQFVIMFKSIYLEGFSRPKGGVRTIINLLLDKYEALGGELRFRSQVVEITNKNNKVTGVVLKNGEHLEADLVISSMGNPETMAVLNEYKGDKPEIGKLSFTESIAFLDKKPAQMGLEDTIIFYNNREKYLYRRPDSLYDNKSAVICLPNNFADDDFDEGIIRLTNMANYGMWKELARPVYKEEKEKLFLDSMNIVKNIAPNFSANILMKDVFSPTTIERYTGHMGGTVYGSTQKVRNGATDTSGLILCGTDQGFLGIVGSMLSGISMANLYGLMD
jgi:phytoene dehydrogenase-like protein